MRRRGEKEGGRRVRRRRAEDVRGDLEREKEEGEEGEGRTTFETNTTHWVVCPSYLLIDGSSAALHEPP